MEILSHDFSENPRCDQEHTHTAEHVFSDLPLARAIHRMPKARETVLVPRLLKPRVVIERRPECDMKWGLGLPLFRSTARLKQPIDYACGGFQVVIGAGSRVSGVRGRSRQYIRHAKVSGHAIRAVVSLFRAERKNALRKQVRSMS